MNKGVGQVVVDFAKALVSKAYEVERGGRALHALQLEYRVELEQRAVIFATLLGKTGRCKEGDGKIKQGFEELSARDFTPQLAIGKVLCLPF